MPTQQFRIPGVAAEPNRKRIPHEWHRADDRIDGHIGGHPNQDNARDLELGCQHEDGGADQAGQGIAHTGQEAEQGIEPEAIQPQRVEVTDLLAQPYRPEGAAENRFILAQTVIVRTEQVDRVARPNQQTGELVKRGVVLADTGGPTYLFTRLNEIKPKMLAEATRNARVSAEQFSSRA